MNVSSQISHFMAWATSNRWVAVVLSFLALGLVWHTSAVFADPEVLPAPATVWRATLRELQSGEMVLHTAITLGRVFAAFVVSMVIGTAIGLSLGIYPRINRFLDSWVIVFLNIPALVVIVLAYIWLGLNETAAIAAVSINKIPNVIVTLREGARALDRTVLEVATVFRVGRFETFRHVVLPQLQPYFAAASRSGLSLIWKIVLVVELLGRPNGVGFKINLYFQLFDVATILAYTLTFVLIMIIVDIVLVQPFERYATRWRKLDA